MSQRTVGRRTRFSSPGDHAPLTTLDWREHLLNRIGTFLLRVPADRWLMAVVTGLTLTLYLWNAPHALDLPEYDEAAYFSRGYHLLLGDFKTAEISNPNTSPISVLYYALWYALLRTPSVYPLVMTSSLFLLGLGAYLLLSRILHPTLSWALATVAVMGSAPFAPWNANYYLGAAILWLSLALLDHNTWRRALAPLGVLLAIFARPEFVVVLLILLIALGVYEWRLWKNKRIALSTQALAYTPLALALLIFVWMSSSVPRGEDYRSAVALPWSYNDFYNVQYHAQFNGADSYANPWIIYEHDFGPVQPRTTSNTLLALLRNPSKSAEYVTFDTQRLWASFATSALESEGWRSDEWESKLVVDMTSADSALLAFYLLALLASASAAYLWLRRERALDRLPITRNIPALIGLGSLGALLIPLLLINPHQRFFMLFPLALLLVGACLTLILAVPILLLLRLPRVRLALPPPIMLAVMALLTLALILVATPQPYLTTSVHPIASTVDFLKAHVVEGSTIVGEPAISYANYLEADGITVHAFSPVGSSDQGLVGAFLADPSLSYAILTRWYGQQTYDQWFRVWNATFPQLPWRLIAQDSNLKISLYGLPPHSSGNGMVSYVLWQREAHHLNLAAPTLPPMSALDFDESIRWQSTTPGHDAIPLARSVGNVPAKCWIMHPYYPVIETFSDVTWQVEANLPSEWSGRQMVFFAALAPWAASQPDAEGVKLTFSVKEANFARTIEVLNDPEPHWTPIVLDLPAYSGLVTLSLSISPRVSIANDSTLISFIAVSNAAQ